MFSLVSLHAVTDDQIHGAEAHANAKAREGQFRTVYMSRLVSAAWGHAPRRPPRPAPSHSDRHWNPAGRMG